MKYTRPYLEILLFDDEEVMMGSSDGDVTAANKAKAYILGKDADNKANVTVNLNDLNVVSN